jgi:hypothetical protein
MNNYKFNNEYYKMLLTTNFYNILNLETNNMDKLGEILQNS